MSGAEGKGRRGWTIGLLLLLPPLMLGGMLWVRSSRRGPGTGATTDQGASEVAKARESAVAIDSWADGKPRTLARDWYDGAATFQELCFHAKGGHLLGCGVLRDDEPWEGTFVDWGGEGENRSPFQIRIYKQGKRHGTWRTFLPTGEIAIEIEYQDGLAASRKVRGPHGELQAAPERAAHLPPGTIPPRPSPRPPPP
ncbi:MAG: hypothetical protein HY901_01835 [Deltaproteobacteria bacterium]|nr:hypothetical protein [Deltaproteobacteria bacterium]